MLSTQKRSGVSSLRKQKKTGWKFLSPSLSQQAIWMEQTCLCVEFKTSADDATIEQQAVRGRFFYSLGNFSTQNVLNNTVRAKMSHTILSRNTFKSLIGIRVTEAKILPNSSLNGIIPSQQLFWKHARPLTVINYHASRSSRFYNSSHARCLNFRLPLPARSAFVQVLSTPIYSHVYLRLCEYAPLVVQNAMQLHKALVLLKVVVVCIVINQSAAMIHFSHTRVLFNIHVLVIIVSLKLRQVHYSLGRWRKCGSKTLSLR